MIGCSGGGKSTLAKALAGALALPYLSMDREFFWLPVWRLRPREQARAMIAEAVKQERWIIDGTGSNSFDLRMPRAEAVIWLQMPRWLCLSRILWRRVRFSGRSRPDMADGCPERIDMEFLRYIWNFNQIEVPDIEQKLSAHGPNVPVFKLTSPKHVSALIAAMPIKRKSNHAAI